MSKLLVILELLFFLSNLNAFSQCTNVALNKPATASGVWQTNVAANGVNGNCSDSWNSGNYATQSYTVDLQGTFTINNINIMFAMTPNGNVNHQIFTSPDMATWTQVDVVTGFFVTGQLIERCYSAAPLTNVRGVRVTSVSSPSWISIIEMGVYTLSAPLTPTITPSGSLAICPGQSLTLTSSSATTYLWSNGATSQSITVNTPGNYSVQTSQASTCNQGTLACTTCGLGVASVTVTANPTPTISVTPNSPTVCGGNPVTLTASGASSYSWSPTVGLNTSTGTSVISNPNVTTNYTVTGTAANGCFSTANVTVNVTAPPSVSIITPVNPLCDSTRLNWGTWTSVTGTSGSATISSNLSINVSKPTGGMSTTAGMFNGGVFPPQFNVPINSTALRNDLAGLFTFCFNQPVVNPQIAIASIGNANTPVQINTSVPYEVIWQGLSMQYPTNTSFIGAEGFTIVMFPGTHSCISFDYLQSEVYCNLAFGTLDTNCQILTRPFICPGQSDNLIATGAQNYVWSPALGLNTTLGPSVSASPSASTMYYVTGTDVNGCASSDSVLVNVHPPLAVSAPADASVCIGTNVSLTATPNNPQLQYIWTPSSGVTGANTANASLVAQTTTNYTLSATDANGCSNSDDFLLTVYNNPVPQITVNNHCLGSPFPFTEASTSINGSITSRLLRFGDGNSSSTGDTYTYSAAGTYQTTLVVQDAVGCIDSLTNVSVVVYDLPTASFAPQNNCEGTLINFASTSTPSGNSTLLAFDWDMGDNMLQSGNLVSHTYPTSGNYMVNLYVEDSNGCRDTTQQSVSIYSLPNANFSVMNVCLGQAICPAESSLVPPPENITTFQWDWGDGSAFDPNRQACHTYVSDGSYDIELVVETANGCSDTLMQQVQVEANPTASFTATGVCEGTLASFTNNSAAGTSSILQNQWDYGDGNFHFNQLNGSNTFNTFGTYPVALVVATSAGCSDTLVQNFQVFQNPLPGFVSNDTCQGVARTFTDTTFISPPASILNQLWTLGDGSAQQSGNSITHIYANAGNFNVTLQVISNEGCQASITHVVNSVAKPQALFIVADVCENDASMFNDNSSSLQGQIIGWNWDFGNGNTSVLQNPSYTFTPVGGQTTFPVSLIVTTDLGCSASVIQDAIIHFAPQISFTTTPQTVCLGQSVQFTGNDLNLQNPAVAWTYNFNNMQGLPLPSAQAYSQNASFTYNSALNYNVQLTATSAFGCSHIFSDTITVNPIPFADFSANNVCLNSAMLFSDASTISFGTIQQYNWQLGDGTVSSIHNPTHLYATAGSKQVTLTVLSADNCVATNTKTVWVNPNPVANFTTTDVCLGDTTFINNLSYMPGGLIANQEWNWGDGTTTQVGTGISHAFTTPNIYRIQLIAVSDSGCTDTFSLPHNVFPNPVALFSLLPIDNQCMPVEVRLLNESSIEQVAGQQNELSFWLRYGDGNSGSNFIHTYTQAGLFDVNLIASSENGCIDTFSLYDIVEVYPIPTANFSQSSNLVDMFEPTVQFENLSMGETQYLWNFNDGSASANIPSPFHVYTDTGCFQVDLRVENQYGCADSIPRNVCVIPFFTLWVPNAITANADDKNSLFKAVGEGIKEFEIRIFNRWGEEVFRSKDVNEGWDGTDKSYQNTEAKMDVYVWLINVKDYKRKVHSFEGRVTVVR